MCILRQFGIGKEDMAFVGRIYALAEDPEIKGNVASILPTQKSQVRDYTLQFKDAVSKDDALALLQRVGFEPPSYVADMRSLEGVLRFEFLSGKRTYKVTFEMPKESKWPLCDGPAGTGKTVEAKIPPEGKP